MKIPQVLPEDNILECCEKAVTDILIDWHSAPEGLRSGPDARTNDDVTDASCDEPNGKRYHPGIILIIRVKHDDNVCSGFERFSVACLLIGAVTQVLLMKNRRQTELLCDFNRVISATIVSQNNFVNDSFGD